MTGKGNRRFDQRWLTGLGLGLIGLSFLVVVANVVWPQFGAGLGGLWTALRVLVAGVLVLAWVILNIPPPQLPKGEFILALADLGESHNTTRGTEIVPAPRTLWDEIRATLPANVPLPETLPDPRELWARLLARLGLVPEPAATAEVRVPIPSLATAAARAAGELPVGPLPAPRSAGGRPEYTEWVPPAQLPAPMPTDPISATNWLLRRLTERWEEEDAERDGAGEDPDRDIPPRTAADIDFVPDAPTARAQGAGVGADVVVWGAMQAGARPAFAVHVEILRDLERRAQPGDVELRLVGLQAFRLGPLAPNRPELLFAVLTGLADYAARDFRTALNEWNIALIAARVDRDMEPPLQPDAEAVVHFYRGNTFFLQGADLPSDRRRETLQTAEAAYLAAIEVNPALAEAHHNLGLVYQAQGRLDKAQPALAQALELAPRLDRARFNLGVLLLNLGQMEKATGLFEGLRDDHLADAEIWRALGRIYRLGGHARSAERALREAIRLDATYAPAYADLAVLYYEQSRPVQQRLKPLVTELNRLQQILQDAAGPAEQAGIQQQIDGLEAQTAPLWRRQQEWLGRARAELQQALALRPANAFYHYNLAVILDDSGEPTAAADEFNAVERLHPVDAADFGLRFDRLGRVDRSGGFLDASALRQASTDTFIQVGMELQQEGRIAEATDQFIRVLYLDPSNPDANYRLGMVYMAQDEVFAAQQHLSTAVNSPHPPPWPPSDAVDALATIYRNRHEYDRALELLQAQLARDPHDARAFYNLGTIHRRQNKLDEAIAAFRAAIQYDPRLEDAHYNLGVAYIASGRIEEGREEFRRYAELNPQDPNTHVLVGVTLKDARQYEAARAELERAVRLNPDHIEAHYNLGLVYQALGRADAASFEFRDVLRLDPHNTRALTRLGIAYADARKLDDALAIFTRLAADDPNNAEAHYNLGIIYQAKDDLPGVIREFREVVRLRPDDAAAFNTLGMAFRTADQIVPAEAAFRRAVALQPDLAEAHYSLARILTSTNRTPEAIEEFRIYEDLKDRERLAALRQERALSDAH